MFGVQLFLGAARHHTDRCSGSEGLFRDLIPHLKSSGNFGAMIGGSHTVPRWAEVREMQLNEARNLCAEPTERNPFMARSRCRVG